MHIKATKSFHITSFLFTIKLIRMGVVASIFIERDYNSRFLYKFGEQVPVQLAGGDQG